MKPTDKHPATLDPLDSLDRAMVARLARFRYQLRQFLRFSEQAARAERLTPQQHQLLLGVAGFTGEGWATITDLAEFLQERHNAVVGLVDRAKRRGLVRKTQAQTDRRVVRVSLTALGTRILARLASLHREEVARLARTTLEAAGTAPRLGGRSAARPVPRPRAATVKAGRSR